MYDKHSKKASLLIFSGALLLFSIFSCKKFVEVNAPKNLLVNSNVFTSDASATSAISGIYSNMVNSGFTSGTSGVTILAGLSSDELINYTTDATLIQFYQNGITPDNSSLNSYLWASAYNDIYAANELIKGLSNSTAVSPALKTQLIGEAKVIRAFCHFYLVNLFGDIPLITNTDYSLNSTATRTPKKEVYAQIISDLKDAQAQLTDDYSYSNGERVRPNKWVATALLARAYLYTGDWANAEAQATAIINHTSTYGLVTDLNQVFLKNSNEAIWQFSTISPNPTSEGNSFILNGVPSSVALSDQVVSSFETGDNRKVNWVNSITVTTSEIPKVYYYAFKYKIQGSTNTTEYSMVLRLAEQYLIRAEAEANGAGGGLSAAVNDLNVIRKRAGLPGYTGVINLTALSSSILHERQVELFTEWGHRWLDLKRTGTVDAVMSSVSTQKGSTWNTNWQLYPIPLVQLQNDPNMTNSQNLGY